MYRRQVFEELGGFRNDYLHADTDLAYRLLDRYKLGFVHDVLTWTGQHEGRIEVASIKAGHNITEYLDFGFKNLENYKSIKLSDKELTQLVDHYADRVLEFRINRLSDFDFRLPRRMTELIPVEVSSRYGAVVRKNWRRYIRRFLSTVKRAIFNRS